MSGSVLFIFDMHFFFWYQKHIHLVNLMHRGRVRL